MYKKPRLIIVEGSQGVGKGTITNILREQMTYTNLLRLSGIKDTSIDGKSKVFKARYNELQMILNCARCDINFILDRSHLSEKVYANLGYKDYDFHNEAKLLNLLLADVSLVYDVQVVILTATEEDFRNRLKRDKPEFEASPFSVSNSLKQQKEYIKEAQILKRVSPDMEVAIVNTSGKDPYDIAYDIIHYRD